MPETASYDLDLRTACAAQISRAGFVADGNYPLLTEKLTDATYWRNLWEYFINGKLPPGTRVICGIAIPYFSTDHDLSYDTALALGLTPSGTAEDIDNQICAWRGSPYG